VVVEVEQHEHFERIFWAAFEDGSRKLATLNLAQGHSVYGERLFKYQGSEYRVWDPYRSKLAAAILNGLDLIPIRGSHKVLYLGAASGTTPSHVSDIVGNEGHVFCVEFAARSMRELVEKVAAYRSNISPILSDARLPEHYAMLVSQVDDIYCDVAQPEQARILADNADRFLRLDGWIMLAVKAQSIDVTKDPSEVYKQEVETLGSRGFQIMRLVHLEPYDKAHAMVVAQKTQ
jgi:fibrillarin-like pre-rRNA processing protein